MSGTIIDQGQVDKYYEEKKDELRTRLLEYVNAMKRITKEQRKQLEESAKEISFSTANDFNDHVQQLPTISKRDKKKIDEYLQSVEWLPNDVTAGFLDGRLVCKISSNTQAEEMIKRAFGNQNGDDDSEE